MTLTPRQTQILTLFALGYSSKMIADKLGIADNTVQMHRAYIKERLGAKNTADMVRIGMINNLIEGASLSYRSIKAFAEWITSTDCPYAIMYGGTPELEKDYRFAGDNTDYTIDEVIEKFNEIS